MAIAITPITVSQTVASVQITGFSIDYENLSMTSSYMTLLEDGTPYQRSQATTSDPLEIQGFMDEVEALIRADITVNMDAAAAQVAYGFVLSKLG